MVSPETDGEIEFGAQAVYRVSTRVKGRRRKQSRAEPVEGYTGLTTKLVRCTLEQTLPSRGPPPGPSGLIFVLLPVQPPPGGSARDGGPPQAGAGFASSTAHGGTRQMASRRWGPAPPGLGGGERSQFSCTKPPGSGRPSCPMSVLALRLKWPWARFRSVPCLPRLF